jgi:hypothetical protein
MPDAHQIAGEVVTELLSLERRGRLTWIAPQSLYAMSRRLTRSRVVDQWRHLRTMKRGSGELTNQDDFSLLPDHRGPTAAELAEARELRSRLLGGLRPSELRFVRLKLRGADNRVAAAAVGWHVRKAQRFLVQLSARV